MKLPVIKRIKSTAIILAVILLSGCKKDDFKPEESFIKIYNDPEGNRNYVPLSIQQTNDQGFLILSAYDGWNILAMKVDKTGEFVWRAPLPSTYVNATPNLIRHQDNFYFVCMDRVGLFSYLMQIDDVAGVISEVSDFQGIIYPTSAYSNGISFFIQNYERSTYQTGIHRLDASLTGVSQSGSLNILTDVEDKIVDHINYTGRRMPFFVHTTPENDYLVMSCFYNYSFSLVFLNPNLQFSGVYNGANFNGGVNAALPLGNSAYAVARFSFDNQYFTPGISLNASGIDIAENIQAQGFSELNPAKPVVIRTVVIDGTEYVAMIASTRSNQLLIGFFDGSGALKGKKYIGKNTPYAICDARSTEDGGLMLLIQAKIMGSYNRIATIRLSDEELKAALE